MSRRRGTPLPTARRRGICSSRGSGARSRRTGAGRRGAIVVERADSAPGTHILAGVQVLLRQPFPRVPLAVAYVPRGPLADPLTVAPRVLGALWGGCTASAAASGPSSARSSRTCWPPRPDRRVAVRRVPPRRPHPAAQQHHPRPGRQRGRLAGADEAEDALQYPAGRAARRAGPRGDDRGRATRLPRPDGSDRRRATSSSSARSIITVTPGGSSPGRLARPPPPSPCSWRPTPPTARSPSAA